MAGVALRSKRKLSRYDLGRTPFFALRTDPRFSYCLYVPPDYGLSRRAKYPLAVIVHGSRRTAEQYRDAFAGFARRQRCIVLAPLFPRAIDEPPGLDGYKQIKVGDTRYDLVLLDMVAEVAERYRVYADRFLLHGFSGGGQFAHRFYYLHPERLMAVSIGAPGAVTLLDRDRDWWCGVGDLESQLGHVLDYGKMRRVAVQMVIGAKDTRQRRVRIRPTSPLWMEGANATGRHRRERLRALKASFKRAGIRVRYDVVRGVGHDGRKVLRPVKTFFAEALATWRENRQLRRTA
jgi:dienelactone hydrolase